MLSKRISRYIKSLQLKKYRKQEGAFIVEGAKGVSEVLESDFEIEYLLYTKVFEDQLGASGESFSFEGIQVSEKELKQVGTFQSNNAALAVVKMPPNSQLDVRAGLTLALDDVRDPGNLGTIIRIADWYGIDQIICSSESADFYNPKVINASMGSFTRVRPWYTDLREVLDKTDLPVYGAMLEGSSIYNEDLTENAIVVLGNESWGITKDIASLITHPITIPRRGKAESLNVAIATAVILDNFCR